MFLEFSYGELPTGNFTWPMNADCFYNFSETENNNYANTSKPTSNRRYQELETEASYLQAN